MGIGMTDEWAEEIVESVREIGRRIKGGECEWGEVPLGRAGDQEWWLRIERNPKQIRPYSASFGYLPEKGPFQPILTVGEQDEIELSFLLADLLKTMTIADLLTEVPKDDAIAPVFHGTGEADRA